MIVYNFWTCILGDVYAYFKDGDIYGSDELAEKKFVCVYSIKEACAATENTDNAK